MPFSRIPEVVRGSYLGIKNDVKKIGASPTPSGAGSWHQKMFSKKVKPVTQLEKRYYYYFKNAENNKEATKLETKNMSNKFWVLQNIARFYTMVKLCYFGKSPLHHIIWKNLINSQKIIQFSGTILN